MKRITLYLLLVLCLFSVAACKKKEGSIKVEDITVNTMLVRNNGTLQVAFVEDFDKNYYRLSELEEFVKKEVNVFNKKAGNNEVIKIENLQLKNNKAIMLLSFQGMQHYAEFNEAWAAYFNSGSGTLEDAPKTLVSTKDGSLVESNQVFQTGGYKVLALTEDYDVIVEGAVKYHSKNATLADKHKVQTTSEGMTVIVFKP